MAPQNGTRHVIRTKVSAKARQFLKTLSVSVCLELFRRLQTWQELYYLLFPYLCFVKSFDFLLDLSCFSINSTSDVLDTCKHLRAILYTSGIWCVYHDTSGDRIMSGSTSCISDMYWETSGDFTHDMLRRAMCKDLLLRCVNLASNETSIEAIISLSSRARTFYAASTECQYSLLFSASILKDIVHFHHRRSTFPGQWSIIYSYKWCLPFLNPLFYNIRMMLRTSNHEENYGMRCIQASNIPSFI